MIKGMFSQQDLKDVFTIIANQRNILPTVVEKDFWITWCLNKLFTAQLPVSMAFKGGTSLSKGFNLINRLSEDCDITLNRLDLGFLGNKDPLMVPSRKQRDRLLDELKLACNEYVGSTLKPTLAKIMQDELQAGSWELAIEEDPQSLRFYYPQSIGSTHDGSQIYLKQSILLEFGVRGDIYPTENMPIKSYVSEEFNSFSNYETLIPCLSPLRTFWEKATLIHAEFHRPIEKSTPERLSRHYYDLSMLYRAGYTAKAIQQRPILNDVIKNKTLLFPSAWAKYDMIWTDYFRISPRPERLEALEKDYNLTRDMMLFGDNKPTFNDLLLDMQAIETHLKILEKPILT